MSDKERIRMELYKEAYLIWLPKINDYTRNIAKSKADQAVDSFDEKFKEIE